MDKDITISKEEQPLMVTIRCITYNHEPYIRQCLEGFVMQKTNFRFEAVVHDDASTDGTAAIIREYAEKYPDIIKPLYETENQYSKHDGSLNRIMNAHMHGKYIAMCEGDDYWIDPLKLQKQVDFLEKNPEYSFCCHRFQMYNELTQKFGKEYAYDVYSDGKDLEITKEIFFKTWVTQPLTALIRLKKKKKAREEFGQYKYYRDVHLFYFLLHKCGKGISLNQFMGVYRLHQGGIAGLRSPVEKYKESVLIYQEMLPRLYTDIYLWKAWGHCLLGFIYFKFFGFLKLR